MIELDPSLQFGRDTHRICSLHLDDDRLCIKVTLDGGSEKSSSRLNITGTWCDFYNTEHPHPVLDDRTPEEAYGDGQPVDMISRIQAA